MIDYYQIMTTTRENNLYNKNLDLASDCIKRKVQTYIYSRIGKLARTEPILNTADLDNIRNNEYIICPEFVGTRSWISFFRSAENYYAVTFPKEKVRTKNPIIYPINVSVCSDFYRGTIMEGIYYRIQGERYWIIDEVYILTGQNELLKAKDDRLDHLFLYFKDNVINNNNNHLYVSQYYRLDKNSLQDLYQRIKENKSISELIFYPKIFGRKIYSYLIQDTDFIEHVVKISQFYMQVTANSDVYYLLAETSGERIGIAYIPDMRTSKMCQQWFKNTQRKKLLVKCQMDISKQKWVPVEIV